MLWCGLRRKAAALLVQSEEGFSDMATTQRATLDTPANRRGRVRAAAPRRRRGSRRWPGALTGLAATSRLGRLVLRYRRELLFGLAALLLVGGTAAVVLAYPAAYGRGVTLAATARTITGNAEADKTVLGCVRGATASALSAAVPAAPLAATGVLMPGSAVLVATASAIGCGVGALSTTTTSGFEWLLKQSPDWFSNWFGA